MKESILLTGLGILCLVAVAIAGCTGIGPGNSPVSPATPPYDIRRKPVHHGSLAMI